MAAGWPSRLGWIAREEVVEAGVEPAVAELAEDVAEIVPGVAQTCLFSLSALGGGNTKAEQVQAEVRAAQ